MCKVPVGKDILAFKRFESARIADMVITFSVGKMGSARESAQHKRKLTLAVWDVGNISRHDR